MTLQPIPNSSPFPGNSWYPIISALFSMCCDVFQVDFSCGYLFHLFHEAFQIPQAEAKGPKHMKRLQQHYSSENCKLKMT